MLEQRRQMFQINMSQANPTFPRFQPLQQSKPQSQYQPINFSFSQQPTPQFPKPSDYSFSKEKQPLSTRSPPFYIDKKPCKVEQQVIKMEILKEDSVEETKEDIIEEKDVSPGLKCRVPINLIVAISLYLSTQEQFTKYTQLNKRSRVAMFQPRLRKQRPDPLRVYFSERDELQVRGISSLYKFSNELTLDTRYRRLYSSSQFIKKRQESINYQLGTLGDVALRNLESFLAKSVTVIDYELPEIKRDFNINLELGNDYLCTYFLVHEKDSQRILTDYINKVYLRLENLFELLDRAKRTRKIGFSNVNLPEIKNQFKQLEKNAAKETLQASKRPQNLQPKCSSLAQTAYRIQQSIFGHVDSITFYECQISICGIERMEYSFSALSELIFEDCNFVNGTNKGSTQPRQTNLTNLKKLKVIENGHISLVKDFNEQLQSHYFFKLPILKELIPLKDMSQRMNLDELDLYLYLPADPSDLLPYLSKNAILRDYYTEITLDYIQKFISILKRLEKENSKPYSVTLHIAKFLLIKPKMGTYSAFDFKGQIEGALKEFILIPSLKALKENHELILMEFGVEGCESTLNVMIHRNAGTFYLKYS
ncbi:hypothetical protein FGO68_gene5259 [Halteria grandinella]|uniref:Uncharacterized protein n=1 Tax=Halteria grandinella TaxID=5974 RepID=A0A8J8T3Y5_HALGN|nr:hypothetical protein FGO68_gene5259 [Halteria grandinella]